MATKPKIVLRSKVKEHIDLPEGSLSALKLKETERWLKLKETYTLSEE